jgi:FkbM family methyltransferase
VRKGIRKEDEDHKWVAENWGGQRSDGSPGLHYMLNPSKLPSHALILDVGTWHGRDISFFMKGHGSSGVQIHTYDAVDRAEMLKGLLQKYPQVTSHPFGLGSANRTAHFTKAGGTDDEGTFEQKGSLELNGTIMDVMHELTRFQHVHLLHINCEGCESEVLHRLLTDPVAHEKIDVIEVQFHFPVVSEADYCEIEQLFLVNGYVLQYRFQYVWEAWSKNKA